MIDPSGIWRLHSPIPETIMAITTNTTNQGVEPNLEDQVCLVTGGSRGIGRAISLELGRHGADVAVNYYSSEEAANEVVDAIAFDDVKSTAIQCDVADRSAVEKMVTDVHSSIGEIDILVNNAGVTADSRFETMSSEEWWDVIEINLGGPFHCTKAFYDDLQSAEHGRVINIGSIVGQQGNFGQANYAAAKSGLAGFTRTLAVELADTGTTVNCVAPGFTETDMLSTVPDRIRQQIVDQIPLNRFAEPTDIAGVVRFLASPAAQYLTGQVLGVNGGMHR